MSWGKRNVWFTQMSITPGVARYPLERDCISVLSVVVGKHQSHVAMNFVNHMAGLGAEIGPPRSVYIAGQALTLHPTPNENGKVIVEWVKAPRERLFIADAWRQAYERERAARTEWAG